MRITNAEVSLAITALAAGGVAVAASMMEACTHSAGPGRVDAGDNVVGGVPSGIGAIVGYDARWMGVSSWDGRRQL